MIAQWNYTQNIDSDEPIMLINNHIGFDQEDGMGIDGAQFQSELLALDDLNKKSIKVWINSPGGSVMDGYNIYTAILKSKTKVDTYCTGMAASIAAVIFQAGRNRIMCDYGFLMYHNPHGPSDGKLIDMMTDSLAKMVARSGKSEEDILKMMRKETFINAEESLEYGLCDSIEESAESNKKRSPAKAIYREAQLVLNSLFSINDKNSKTMIKVANRLNLNAEASEDAIVSEIDRIQNKAKDEKESFEQREKDLKDKMKKLEDEMEDLKKEKDKTEKDKVKAEKDCEDMKKEKEGAEDKAKEEEAKNFLQTHIKAGRIKNTVESLSFWTAIYKADPAVCKKQLEDLPLNKIGVKIETGINTDNEQSLTQVAAKAMADVRNKLKIA